LIQGFVLREVIVYDDHSTDRTSEVINEYAARDNRVRQIQPDTLPSGWCGKNFACHRLSSEAKGEWLLFLDADARLTKNAAARMLEESSLRNVTLLSSWPGLEMSSFWEKVLMPMLNFVVFTLFPAPLSVVRKDASLGLAHGACLLAHRRTYTKIGGHTLVRDQIFEDTRLAQVWRERGETSLCLDGQSVARVRMYNSFSDIWNGFQNNFYPAFRRKVSFWFFLLFHLSFFMLPFFALPFALFNLAEKWPLVCIALSVITMRMMMAIRFNHPLWSALLHPLAEIVLIALGLSSWWRCRSGKGVEWKGRTYRRTA
jgi:glycosyltransferase involved in cell wall biosynthesis